MAYLTPAELETRFGAGDLLAWTDDDASGALDAAVVAAALAAADAIIDAAASQRYVTPLTLGSDTTARVVRDVAGALAGYRLAARRPRDVPATLRLDYTDALKWLERLRDGKVTLAGEAVVSAAPPSGGIVVGGGSTLVDRDSLDGF